MKYILSLILILFTTGCNSTPQQSSLDQEYLDIKYTIIKNCMVTSFFVKKIATNREAGISLEGITSWIITRSKSDIENAEELQYETTTEDVLYRVFLGVWVYRHEELSPEEIYTVAFNECYHKFIKTLNEQYVYKKNKLNQMPK